MHNIIVSLTTTQFCLNHAPQMTKYETWYEKLQCISISTNTCCQFIQKEKKYFDFYKARRRRRFFGGIFGMRNFGLNFPPPYFFKKVVRRGGEVDSNTADISLSNSYCKGIRRCYEAGIFFFSFFAQ